MAPPIRLAIQTIPCALARSTAGNQREMLAGAIRVSARFARAEQNRIGSSTWTFDANPVRW
jgi:hypothetical protein